MLTLEEQLDGASPSQLEKMADAAAIFAGNVEDAGLVDPEAAGQNVKTSDDPGADEDSPDLRWSLWALLRADRGNDFHWSPFRLTRVLDRSIPTLPSERIEISFDNRISLRRLVAELTRLWPKLRADGWVRGSRPMQPRGAELVTFVCLHTWPDDTWEERWRKWEREQGRPNGWSYTGYRPFYADFRRYELALTGERKGLAVFYDGRLLKAVKATMDMTPDELLAGARTGDPDVTRVLRTLEPLALSALLPAHERLWECATRAIAQELQDGNVTWEEASGAGEHATPGLRGYLMNLDLTVPPEWLGGLRVDEGPASRLPWAELSEGKRREAFDAQRKIIEAIALSRPQLAGGEGSEK